LISEILFFLTQFIINTISFSGYWGIAACMAIESACIPLPSEIIMPFSGYLVLSGKFSLLGVTLAGAFGNLLGSAAAYMAGYFGGRPFVERFGKYILISRHDVGSADKWFSKYGDMTVFVSRMLPIIRTFISLPAGIYRMNFVKFTVFTFAGSLPWCLMLAYIGIKLGENWTLIEGYFRKADIAVGILLAALIIYWVVRHLRKN